MAILEIYPDGPFNLKDAFYKLGTQDIDTLHINRGIYGEAQGVYGFNHPGAPDGKVYEVHWDDEAVVDLGIRNWTDKFQPGTRQYRTIKLGPNMRFIGPGLLMASLWVDSRFYWEDFTISSQIMGGMQELATSEGDITLLRGAFRYCGVDPYPEDPVWEIIARVPVGLILNAGELAFDIHEAVAQAGMTGLIPPRDSVEGPDIEDTDEFYEERYILRTLCKQLAYKGDGEHGVYSAGGGGIILDGVVFDHISGYAVFFNGRKPMRMNRLSRILAKSTAGLYGTWNSMTMEGLSVLGCETNVNPRGDYEPKDTYGFVLNNPTRPFHEGNVFRYKPGFEGVYGYRVWNDQPLPSGILGDKFYSDSGEPVPVLPTGFLLTEVELPPDPPVEAPTVSEMQEALTNLRLGIEESCAEFASRFGIYPSVMSYRTDNLSEGVSVRVVLESETEDDNIRI